MAESIELPELGSGSRDAVGGQDEDYETAPHINISTEDASLIHTQETALVDFTGDTLANARRQLLKTKVDAFLKEVDRRDGLLPGPDIYNEFELGDDGRALFLKEGHKRVTWEKDSTNYRTLHSIGTADFIRTHLFPNTNQLHVFVREDTERQPH